MRFVTEDNESVSLNYDGDIYCLDTDGHKIARFIGSHPLADGIEKILDEDINFEIECTPDQWDAWTILKPVNDNMVPILQRLIASLFSQQEAVSRLLMELN